MTDLEKELLQHLKLALEEINAWRGGLNNRSMNKCKVGAIFTDRPSLRTIIAKAEGRS